MTLKTVNRLTSEYVTPQTLTVTLVSPINDAEALSPTAQAFAWTLSISTQAQYRLQIATDDSGDSASLVYDTQWTTSAVTSVSLDLRANGVDSNLLYYWKVYAANTDGQEGESGWESFVTAFPTSANVTGLTATPVGDRCGYDATELPGVRLSWTAVVTNPAIERFVAYEVRRREGGTVPWIKIARLTGQGQTSYVDCTVKAYTPYQYAVVYYADSTTPETLVSAIQSPSPVGYVTFDFPFLHSTLTPTLFVQMPAEEGTVTPQQNIEFAQTWGRQNLTAFVGELLNHQITLRGLEQLRAYPRKWSTFLSLYEAQAVGDTLCFRSGIDREVYFVVMTGMPKTLTQRSWTAEFALTQIEYDEELGLFVHTPVSP